MNPRTRRLAGGAAALGAGAMLIGPISALAQSDDDPPASTTPATTDGSDEGTVAPAPDDETRGAKADMAARLAEVLQPLVDAGTITQAQLDAVTQALQDAGPVFGGRHGGRFGHVARVSLETAATAIGISEDDLRAALADGETLAEVATANGVEPQTVIDALVAEARTRLDEAVAAGRLEQAEADERLTEITGRITTGVEEGFPTRAERGRWRDRDEATADDEATPADETPATAETTPPTTDGGG